jgi:ubiquitin-protein ligase
MSTIFERRVEQEWRLLQSLSEANPGVLTIASRTTDADSVLFDFTLDKTQALIADGEHCSVQESHHVTFRFPRFFPSMPIEATLVRPVFHPNIHPHTGFVCLWGRFSSGDTVIEAVAQLQRVITWELVNREADHVMQPIALEWLDQGPTLSVPLRYQEVEKPDGFLQSRTYRSPLRQLRRRLS